MGAKKVITLSDGVEITVDSSSLLQKEFRGFFDPRVSDKASDKVRRNRNENCDRECRYHASHASR